MSVSSINNISTANSSSSNNTSNNNNNNNNHSPNQQQTLVTSIANSQIVRKRKVKFTIHLNIQELLSVSYLNGVLFCKVRLCDGGNHISYSSKKEVSNSSVSWSTDLPIQFDVKTVQLYTITSDLQSTLAMSVVGYEPCLCRVSVRKELRGGKSYQKLGYVDYNLADYILKYQQEYQQLEEHHHHHQQQPEFCVNRILKEYDASTSSNASSKKTHQRLDNSYLKVNIKVTEAVNGKRTKLDSMTLKKTPLTTMNNATIKTTMLSNAQMQPFQSTMLAEDETDLVEIEAVQSKGLVVLAKKGLLLANNNNQPSLLIANANSNVNAGGGEKMASHSFTFKNPSSFIQGHNRFFFFLNI